MPQIKEYGTRVETSGPVQTRRLSGNDFGGSAGKIYQAAGEAVEQTTDTIYKSIENRESTDANIAIANTHAELTGKLNKQLKDGTIDSEKFMNEYDEKMGQLSGNFTTRGAKEYFNKSNAQLRNNFLVSSVSAQSEVAGIKTMVGFQESQTKLSSGIMNDPSSYKTALDVQTAFLDQKVADGSLPFKDAEKLKLQTKTELAKSAVRGWAQLNPEDAMAQLKQGLWDDAVDGDVKKQLMGEAQMAISARETEALRRDAEAKKAKELSDKNTQNQFLSKMYKGELSTDDIIKSNLEFDNKKEMLSLLRIQTEEGSKIKMDAAVFTDLYQRANLPDGDPNRPTYKEIQSKMGKGLTLENVNNLLKELDGDGTPEGETRRSLKKTLMETARAKLVKKNGFYGEDPDGLVRLAAFQAEFDQAYQAQKAAGKRDIDLFNPASPDYMGKMINNFVPSGQQIFDARFSRKKNEVVTDKLTTGTALALPPEKRRKEGESIEAWRARTKGN